MGSRRCTTPRSPRATSPAAGSIPHRPGAALLRKAQGLTQARLSVMSGVPQRESSRLESGRANATELTLFRVAHAMGHAFRLEPVGRGPRRSVAAKKGRIMRKRATRSRELGPA
ncbi:helix-turn-helix domain-containing protein [Corallococcus sp. RDP092CA]|uniref:helix-turn-helix domain-containing protein n=1 Tax=Corallococcus sp. RDP092CA TaxID=3109369 RepID=UPI0035AF9CE3